MVDDLLQAIREAAQAVIDEGSPWEAEGGCQYCGTIRYPHRNDCAWRKLDAALDAIKESE